MGPGEDFGPGFRPREELAQWIENDQLGRLAGLIPPGARSAIQGEVDAKIREAFAFAERSPFPDASELHSDVFKEP